MTQKQPTPRSQTAVLTYILVPEVDDIVKFTCAVAATNLFPQDARRVNDSAKQDGGRDVGCQQ